MENLVVKGEILAILLPKISPSLSFNYQPFTILVREHIEVGPIYPTITTTNFV